MVIGGHRRAAPMRQIFLRGSLVTTGMLCIYTINNDFFLFFSCITLRI
jgi:hypothetical protein